jgi:DNA-binding transcriptional LysR family regulator
MESGLAMLAFVRTVQCNGFTRAARDLGVTPSAVSKLVTRLERRLGVRLLQRSTRRMALTAEGTLYFERVQRIVAEIEDAESDVMRFSQAPRGRVRIGMGNAFANFALVPALPEFMARYPELSLDLVITEYKLDLVDAGLDLAIRFGPLGDLNLAARRIGEYERVVVAAPGYLERQGTPRTPEELAHHNCLTLAGAPGQTEWPFRGPRGTRSIAVRGNLNIDNAETLYEAALAGRSRADSSCRSCWTRTSPSRCRCTPCTRRCAAVRPGSRPCSSSWSRNSAQRRGACRARSAGLPRGRAGKPVRRFPQSGVRGRAIFRIAAVDEATSDSVMPRPCSAP